MPESRIPVHFLYPNNPLRAKQPDEQFGGEAKAMCESGFEVSLFSFEDFQSGTFHATPPLPSATEVLYRGWMLSETDYGAFASAISRAGARLVTDLQTYLSTHHLPRWYPLLSDLTPETRIFPADCDLEKVLQALGRPEFFIKDYVKSLRTSVGSRISKPEQVTAVITEMRHFRGVIEGGFCVRRVESFVPETERRYFAIGGVPYSATGEVPPIVHECAKRLGSRFYSVDVVRRIDGQLRIVEVGDGQVSDLVGWSADRFADILAEHFRTTRSVEN